MMQFGQRGAPLWRCTRGAVDLTIFGSIHALPPGVIWTSAAFDEALSRAWTIYFEVEPGTGLFSRMAAIPSTVISGSRTLWDLLDAEGAARLRAVAESLGMPLSGMRLQKPYFVANAIEAEALRQRIGMTGRYGVEAQLERRGRQRRLPVRPLEDRLVGTRILGDVPLERQAAYLSRILRTLDQRVDLMRAVIAAWSAGDLDRLTPLVVQDSARLQDLGVHDAMLSQRNRNWADLLRQRREEGPAFVCVGLAHLLAGASLLDALRQAGFATQRL